MNNVYLCTGNYAKNPFYVNFSDISLYSMEELCYYFIDRIYLLDYDIMNQQLVDWIRSECGMNSLADELDIYIRKHVSVAAFVTTILESTGLYDDNTIKLLMKGSGREQNICTRQEDFVRQWRSIWS